MSHSLNETHDPNLRSWIQSANDPGTDFPIQNLPFGVFRRHGTQESGRIGVAIGDRILDLAASLELGLLDAIDGTTAAACAAPRLNALMAAGPERVSNLRSSLSRLLAVQGAPAGERQRAAERALVPSAEAEMLLPADIGDYTDFYASLHHATNVGRMFRPDNPLMPNYKHMPIGYHGRSSSIVVSGTSLRRPCGQTFDETSASTAFGPSKLLDYELEVGFFTGAGNRLGEPIPVDAAERHIFGLCLVNDWSARDIQKWEYQPLGPFLGKSFATSISPWVVTLEALAPFRCAGPERAVEDPTLLPYLRGQPASSQGGFDITVEVWLHSARMRERGGDPFRVSRGNFRDMYWTAAQLVAHHASNGCNLRPGDLLASGTVSGPEPESRGCLLERTWRGSQPLELPEGEQRRFLEDEDEVILRGRCRREGFVSIGFGECRGAIEADPRAGS